MVSKKNQIILQRFGTHLERLRKDRGLSLRELSYACNIDNSKISKIEKGMINITMITILDLAMGLEISPMELLNFQKVTSR
jgi:transcriptional regulator with XRE-family HTH domain